MTIFQWIFLKCKVYILAILKLPIHDNVPTNLEKRNQVIFLLY